MAGPKDDAEFYQQHKDDPNEWGDPELGEPAGRLDVVISVRLTSDQEDRLRAAADRSGLSLSKYLREAALRQTEIMIVPVAVSSSTLSVNSSTIRVGGVDVTLPKSEASTAA